MNYACLKKNDFALKTHHLVPLRYRDTFAIKRWRNEQIAFLRQQEPLTDEMQERYYQTVISPSFNTERPSQILFSFLKDDICVGYGGIVHINWPSKRAEVSFLLDPSRASSSLQYRQEFTIFLTLIKQVAFEELKFHRLFTETFDIRPDHVAGLEENGFLFEGRLKEHVLINGRFVDSLIHGCVHHE